MEGDAGGGRPASGRALALEAGELRLTSAFPLLNPTEPVEVEGRAARVTLPKFATEARGVRARLRAQIPARGLLGVGNLKFLDLAATEVVAQGVTTPHTPRSPSPPAPGPRSTPRSMPGRWTPR